MTALAPALQAFFTNRLITQRNCSPQTIAAYRDTFTLLLRFVHAQTGKQPFELDIDDLDAPLIGAFLTHLERDRGNSARTRNARLGAIHSFYRFAALEHPEHAHTIARVMAIPTKRHERSTVCYLALTEITALLAAPDRNTWLGRRDRALLALMVQTGVRVSELVGLRIRDVHLGTGRHIRRREHGGIRQPALRSLPRCVGNGAARHHDVVSALQRDTQRGAHPAGRDDPHLEPGRAQTVELHHRRRPH